ncbi:methyltransferase domain-containing protein, partial [Candidatus Woesearchaeota archaeon]|nr:methyltransferase domain-containing protein [Candidatus Woesearchaeota archaeon]
MKESPQQKSLAKHPLANKLSFTPEDIRWATPDIVAKYRARRLFAHGKIIADLGSGIGFQTFAFAEKFEKVYAVEIDEEKIERAKTNANILGIKNIQFIHGDALNQKVI